MDGKDVEDFSDSKYGSSSDDENAGGNGGVITWPVGDIVTDKGGEVGGTGTTVTTGEKVGTTLGDRVTATGVGAIVLLCVGGDEGRPEGTLVGASVIPNKVGIKDSVGFIDGIVGSSQGTAIGPTPSTQKDMFSSFCEMLYIRIPED